MIPIPSGVKVWIATGVTDMRRGMNGLSLQVQEAFGRDPHAGDLYDFRGRRGDLIKVLWHDGLGLSLARTPVGDRYVLEYMREHEYNVGGEPSGHIILSDFTTTGDGFVAALQVLAVLKKQDQPVSKVCHRFDPLPQVLKNVRYRSGKPLETAKVRSAIKEAERRLNGHGRLIVRSSGTEPVIRVMGEGEDRMLVEEVVDGIVDALSNVTA